MLKVVLDSNVLISAIVFGGRPRELFKHILSGKLKLVISENILNEVKNVLAGNKFKYDKEIIHMIIAEIEALAEYIIPSIKVDIIKKDVNDNRVLECAIESGAEYVISGDNHLLDFRKYNNIKILSPAVFLNKYY